MFTHRNPWAVRLERASPSFDDIIYGLRSLQVPSDGFNLISAARIHVIARLRSDSERIWLSGAIEIQQYIA